MSTITVGAFDGGYAPNSDPTAYITTVLNNYAALGYRFTSISGTLLNLTSGKPGYTYLVIGLFDGGYDPTTDPDKYAEDRLATYTAQGWAIVEFVGYPVVAIEQSDTWAILEKFSGSSTSSTSSGSSSSDPDNPGFPVIGLFADRFGLFLMADDNTTYLVQG